MMEKKLVTDYPGKTSEWNGFVRHDFKLNGHDCILVEPVRPLAEKTWFWRARFFGRFPDIDLEMLHQGWYLTYINVSQLFGSPAAVRLFDDFYSLMLDHGFLAKMVIAGHSRGALVVYNWAIQHPDQVICLFLDNPVCDFKSWPGGKGDGPGSELDWQLCLNAYGLTEEEALSFRGNPVDNLEPLAKAGVPILHFCSDFEEIAPPGENSDIVERRYRHLGGHIEVIRQSKDDQSRRNNPRPVVDFILQAYRRQQ